MKQTIFAACLATLMCVQTADAARVVAKGESKEALIMLRLTS